MNPPSSKRRRATGRATLQDIALAAGVSALLLTACASGGGSTTAPTEEPADSGDALPIAEGDRALDLKFGTILPQSGTLAFLGPPEEAGVTRGISPHVDVSVAATPAARARACSERAGSSASGPSPFFARQALIMPAAAPGSSSAPSSRRW